MQERLQKYIARCGVCSRRKAEELIAVGRVQINGKTVTQMGSVINPEKVEIRVDNQIIREATEKVYLMLHKPKRYITTASDPQDRPTVFDLLPNLQTRIFPVGRLDADSEGLLLFTNDGELSNRLIHPRYGVKKKYLVTVQGQLDYRTIHALERGIVLEDGKTAPAKIKIIHNARQLTMLELEISEGKKRQIRRMFLAVAHPAKKLLRIQFGPLSLGNLKSGKFRFLSTQEIIRLKQIRTQIGADKIKTY